ncbi:MAG TPA: ferritin family protein [bacterium]|nr:ferritin family protein [bacterium]
MVLKYLNEDELFKVAMNIEKQGIEFYQNASSHAVTPGAKEIFQFLFGEEKHHYEVFKKMDTDIQRIKFRPEAIDEEISLYLRSLVDSGIFENLMPRNQWKNITDREALNIGIHVEKTSILFYSGIKDITEDPTACDALVKIIAEERSHLIKLTTLWKKLG